METRRERVLRTAREREEGEVERRDIMEEERVAW